jgi:alpha-L-rhamnosidase
MTTKEEITGLVEHSSWISSLVLTDRVEGKSQLTVFKFDFDAPKDLQNARLVSSALGVYKAFINDVPTSSGELLPGYTEYKKHQLIDSVDVTSLIKPGKNNIHLEVSDGWYKGGVGVMRATEQWGDRVAARAIIGFQTSNGSLSHIGTDANWQSRLSSHRADMIYGEFVDFNTDSPGRAEPIAAKNGEATHWQGVETLGETGASLVVPLCAPVRVVESLQPVAIKQTPKGWLVDFGQNIAGWVRLSNLGDAGSQLSIIYGEALDNQGEVTQQNFKPEVPFLPVPVEAGQIDKVISAGIAGQVFEPVHSTKGFRYVRIEGLSGELKPDEIIAQVAHSDLDRLGTFESSSADLNWLHNSTVWSFRGNIIDIPTDCPTRERAGWGADFDIFFDAATFLYDVDGFALKWLYDFAESIFENGIVANMAPSPISEGEHGKIAFTNGSAGWGDAIISIPLKHYKAYGKNSVLESMWPRMMRWISFVEQKAAIERHPNRIERNTTALTHEKYLWDTGFHFGEWLEPGVDVDFPALMSQDKGIIATAFYRKSTQELSVIAGILGKHDDEKRFAELSANIRDAWQKEFLDLKGLVQPATQANCVRALTYDLLDDAQKPVVVQQLVNLVHDANDHISTGFLATPILLPTLADYGHADLAYKILTQRTWPSWLSMKDQGATTIWERWEGYNEEGNPVESHNHYSKGSVITYLHQYVAGIKRSPIGADYDWVIEPKVGAGLTWAKASHQTLAGPIASHWKLSNGDISTGAFELEVTVPVGATAKVVLPNGQVHLVGGGTHVF